MFDSLGSSAAISSQHSNCLALGQVTAEKLGIKPSELAQLLEIISRLGFTKVDMGPEGIIVGQGGSKQTFVSAIISAFDPNKPGLSNYIMSQLKFLPSSVLNSLPEQVKRNLQNNSDDEKTNNSLSGFVDAFDMLSPEAQAVVADALMFAPKFMEKMIKDWEEQMAKDREKFKKDLDASTKKKIEENIQKKISLAKELAKKIASNPDLKKSYVELSVNLNIVINASSNRASNFDIELIKTEILNRNFSSRGSVEQQQEKSTRSIPVFQRYLLGI